jgi:hypothetical protein
MSPSPLAIPLMLLVTTLAVRLSARFLSQTTVQWNHCFGFGILIVMVIWAVTAAGPLFMPRLPFAVALAGICLPFAAIGTWFFSTRAVTAEGKPGGWLNGLNITAGTMLAAVFVVIPVLKMIDRLGQNGW